MRTLVVEFGEELQFRVATDFQSARMDYGQQCSNQPQNAIAILQDVFDMGEAVTYILVIFCLMPC